MLHVADVINSVFFYMHALQLAVFSRTFIRAPRYHDQSFCTSVHVIKALL
jgi:hypothetical protein